MKRILLLEYLRGLRISQPVLFFCVSAFFAIQLALTFIKLEVTPFFLYGMFSEKIPYTDSVFVLKILVNDKPLDEYYSPLRERYLLEETAMNYERMKKNNYQDFIKTRIESGYPSIARLIPGNIYNSREAITAYPSWLKEKCLQIAGLKEGNVKLIRKGFHWNRKHLQLKLVSNEVLEDL